jgi:ABC-type multidrug transport system fused ATPase/permease subunit
MDNHGLSKGQIRRSFYCSWFTSTLIHGSKHKLDISDLPALPSLLETQYASQHFLTQFKITSSKSLNDQSDDWIDKYRVTSSSNIENHRINPSIWPVLRLIWSTHGYSFFIISFIKLLLCGLSFVGPLLLGEIVSYLENGIENGHDISVGITLVLVLCFSSFLSSILSTNINIRYLEVKLSIQSSLTLFVFHRAIQLPLIAWKDLGFSEAQITNFIQIDIDQISGLMNSFNDLWSQPLQIVIAFVLLYLQIKIAFLAGICVIVCMIPLNSIIAKQIGKSTDLLLKQKDFRLKILLEGFQNMISCKMSSLEGILLKTANSYRKKELYYLGWRKYLDAICVFLWATTPVLVPFMTFLTAVLIAKQPLRASNVVTTIALLQMLIFPMNALPWIINGFMEASISLRRISKLLNTSNNQSLHLSLLLLEGGENEQCKINEGKGKNEEAVDSPSKFRRRGGSGSFQFHHIYYDKEQDPFLQSSTRSGSGTGGSLVVDEKQLCYLIKKNSFSWITHPHVASSEKKEKSKKKRRKSKLSADAAAEKKEEKSNSLVESSFTVSLKADIFVKYGKIIGIVGSTSSGKSTLLLGILDELRKLWSYSPQDYRHGSYSFSSIISADAIQLTFSPVVAAAAAAALAKEQREEDQREAVERVTEREKNRSLIVNKAETNRTQDSIIDLTSSTSMHQVVPTYNDPLMKGIMSFCSQVPSIFTGTARFNILLGNSYDATRYHTICEGCSLLPDFDVSYCVTLLLLDFLIPF